MKTIFIKGAFAMQYKGRVILFNPYLMTCSEIPLVDDDVLKSIACEENNLLLQNVLMADVSLSDYHRLSDFFVQKDSLSVDTLYFTDALSYACNLNCVYCMQQNTYKHIQRLSVEDRVMMWKSISSAFGAKDISLTLFGGEPFYDLDYVEQLLSLAETERVPISYIGAVTNGSIVNSKLISLINQYKISVLQITLDGIEPVHNKRRVPKDNKNGYAAILENINQLLHSTDVTIIINTVLDRQNVESYLQMVKELNSRFSEYILSNNPRVVFNLGNECHPYLQSQYTQKNILTEKEQSAYFKSMMGVLELGACIYSPIPTPRCIATSVNEFVLAPNGDVYQCISGLGNVEFLVSKFEEYSQDIGKLVVRQAMSKGPNRIAACKSCENYPLCNGGCYYNMVVEKKSTSCQKLAFQENIDYYMEVIAVAEEIAPNVYRKKGSVVFF